MWWEAAPGLASHLEALKGLWIRNEKEDAAGEQVFLRDFPHKRDLWFLTYYLKGSSRALFH